MKTVLPMKYFIIVILMSCAYGFFEYLEDKVKQPQPSIQRIVISATNDIHGSIMPHYMHVQRPHGVKLSYAAGGMGLLMPYIQQMRKEWGNHHLWLDCGDHAQGSIESNFFQGQSMVTFFNQAGLHAATIGNHEFDFHLEPFYKNLQTAKYPYLSANLVKAQDHDVLLHDSVLPYTVFTIENLKIGVIGATTLETFITTTYGDALKKEAHLKNIAKTVQHYASLLRNQGVQIIVAMVHAGISCQRKDRPDNTVMRRREDVQGTCDKNSEIVQFITEMRDPSLIDLVIAGHSHHLVHHWVHNIPVVQAYAYGKYFNNIYLSYNWETKKLMQEHTVIEGPIALCEVAFAHQSDCFNVAQAEKHQENLQPVFFHNERMVFDPSVEANLSEYMNVVYSKKDEVITRIALPISHSEEKESGMCNLVTDALKDTFKTDFALINARGIRMRFEAGVLTYKDVFRSVPFDNSVVVAKIKGKVMKNIIAFGMRGLRGLAGLSGTLVKLKQNITQAIASGKFSVKNVFKSSGEPILDDKEYSLATLDFLIRGGDGYFESIKDVPSDKILFTNAILRDVLVSYLKKKDTWNSPEALVLDPKKPRLKVVLD